jgi:hypothetical protein
LVILADPAKDLKVKDSKGKDRAATAEEMKEARKKVWARPATKKLQDEAKAARIRQAEEWYPWLSTPIL